jgi:hypothetical protein
MKRIGGLLWEGSRVGSFVSHISTLDRLSCSVEVILGLVSALLKEESVCLVIL